MSDMIRHHNVRGKIRATTILAVRHQGRAVMAGDGQVSLGETIMKQKANKLRFMYKDQDLVGFAALGPAGGRVDEAIDDDPGILAQGQRRAVVEADLEPRARAGADLIADKDPRALAQLADGAARGAAGRALQALDLADRLLGLGLGRESKQQADKQQAHEESKTMHHPGFPVFLASEQP